MKAVIDLNSDLGEGIGHDEEILALVSSANIACGFHAGDPASILASIRSAHKHSVAIGAHPSFFDRENFGRSEMSLPPDEIFAAITYQIGAFRALAQSVEAELTHVKPHGALYNMASRDRALAGAIVDSLCAIDGKLILFAPPKSELERAAQKRKVQTAAEVFADRNYLASGALVPRSSPDAFVRDPVDAAERVLRMLREGKVRSVEGVDLPIVAETICVHGDNPEAVAFVRNLRAKLEEDGVTIAAPVRTK